MTTPTTPHNNEALEACPFCGVMPELFGNSRVVHGVVTDECPIAGKIVLIEAWNTRANQRASEVEEFENSMSALNQYVTTFEKPRFRRFVPKNMKEAQAYIDEMLSLENYYLGLADTWRGIASAMGYEPLAHNEAKPKDKWTLARIAKFKEQARQSTASEVSPPTAQGVEGFKCVVHAWPNICDERLDAKCMMCGQTYLEAIVEPNMRVVAAKLKNNMAYKEFKKHVIDGTTPALTHPREQQREDEGEVGR